MKRRPLRLATAAVADNRELFPDNLFHPPPGEVADRHERVQQLLGEQTELMERAHVTFAGSRSYLRSPLRRLQVIQTGFHSPDRQKWDGAVEGATNAPSGPTDASTASQQATPVAAEVALPVRKPLPPLQSVPQTPRKSLDGLEEYLRALMKQEPSLQHADIIKKFQAVLPLSVTFPQEQPPVPPQPMSPPPHAAATTTKNPSLQVVISDPPSKATQEGAQQRGSVTTSQLTPSSASQQLGSRSPRQGSDDSGIRGGGATLASSASFAKYSGSSEDFQRSANAFKEEIVSDCMPYCPRIVSKNLVVDPESLEAAGGVGNAMSAVSFQPWTGNAALIFIDISGYSKVTTALAPLGAHALSEAVNGYLEKLIQVVVQDCKGDIVKYAGDAILAVWVSDDEDGATDSNTLPASSLGSSPLVPRGGGDGVAPVPSSTFTQRGGQRRTMDECCLWAVACASILQRDFATHDVIVEDVNGVLKREPGAPPLQFQLHIGVSCGQVETSVFLFPQAKNTETAFHCISGAPVQELEGIVSAAMPRETCIASRVLERIRSRCSGLKVIGRGSDIHKIDALQVDALVKSLEATSSSSTPVLTFNASQADNVDNDDPMLLEQTRLRQVIHHFVHPALARRLASSAANVNAEMRFLAVMFILKSDPTATIGDWFAEVQSVLDKNRAAIVKLIDDDKGVHVIAAVGLFSSERDACFNAVTAAQEFTDREIGCTTGIAAGVTFCGVIGSASLSCRWDITSASCVRSCRLMQLAQSMEPEGGCFVDASVLESIENRSMLREHPTRVTVKGSNEAFPVFVLAGSVAQPAWNLTCPPAEFSELAHMSQRQKLRTFVDLAISESNVGVAVIGGCSGVGKTTMCVATAYQVLMTPVLHECTAGAPLFSLALTIAQWFKYSLNRELQSIAEGVIKAFKAQHTSQTRRLLIQLVEEAVTRKRVRFVLVVKQAHLLDELSLAFVVLMFHRMIKPVATAPISPVVAAAAGSAARGPGAGCFLALLCVTPQLGSPSPNRVLRLMRERATHKSLAEKYSILIEISALQDEAIREVASKTFSWDIDDSLFSVLSAYCSGNPLMAVAFAKHVMAQRPYLTTMSPEGVVHLSDEKRKDVLKWDWARIYPSVVPRLLQFYDAVPPKQKVLLRVVAVLMCSKQDWVSMAVLEHVSGKMLRHVSQEAFTSMIQSLQRYHLLQMQKTSVTCACTKTTTAASQDDVATASVALRDSILQTLTPDHRRLILRTAVRYIGNSIDASSGGVSPPWCCPAWMRVRSAQYQVEMASSSSATPDPSLQSFVSVLQDIPALCSGEHEGSSLEQSRLELLYKLRIVPEPAPRPLTFNGTISLDVVAVKNYVPRIATGCGIGGTIFLLCWWMRNVYVLLSRRRPIPDKAAQRGRALVRTYFESLRAIRKFYEQSIPKNSPHVAAIVTSLVNAEDEANLTRIIDNVITNKNPSAGVQVATSACQQLLTFLSSFVVVSQRLEEVAATALMHTTLVEEAFLPATLDSARKSSIVAAVRALTIFKTALMLGTPSKSGEKTASAAESRTALSQLVDPDSTLFHSVMMALATSEFNTRSVKFTLPWIRDAVLKEKRETISGLLSCIYHEYAWMMQAWASSNGDGAVPLLSSHKSMSAIPTTAKSSADAEGNPAADASPNYDGPALHRSKSTPF